MHSDEFAPWLIARVPESGRERSPHEVDAEAWASGRLVHSEDCQMRKTPPPGWPFDGFSCNCRGVESGRSLTEDAP